jgi:4-hydroxy-tetrahydrodipicolinate synthase
MLYARRRIMIDFKGSYTALVTPFTEKGDIDFEGFEKNIRFQIDQGITGILPVGTTGESPTLSTEEHNTVVKKAREFSAGGCDIFAGTGSNSTKEAMGHCRHALDAGVDKVLLVDCYYNGPSSLELRREYYEAILGKYKDIKVIVYVIPGRTGTAISPVDIAIMSNTYNRVIAIKEATGDLDRMAEERSLMPDMSIMSGDDDKTFDMMIRQDIRAAGVISVTSNIAPAAVSAMVQALLENDIKTAKNYLKKLKPLFSIVTVKAKSMRKLPDGRTVETVDRFRNPLAVKTVMNVLGIPAGPVRRPLGKMTREGIQVVRQALNTVYSASPELFAPIQDFYGIDVESRLLDDSLWNKQEYSE